MICLEQNTTTGALQPIYPQPADFTTCTLVAGSYSELSVDVWQITPAQGAEIGMEIMLVWAIAFGFRMVARVISDSTSERET